MNAAAVRRAALAVALVGAAACAGEAAPAADRQSGTMDVARVIVVVPPVPGAPAALYASFANGTGRGDSLLGLSTPVADSATLHTQLSRGALVVMQAVPGVALPAGGTVRFSPGALHSMLAGVRAALTPGDSVAVTFRFAVSPPVTVSARVVGYAELERALDHAGHEEP